MDLNQAKNNLALLKELYHKESGILQELKTAKAEKETKANELREVRDEITRKRTLLQEASDEARTQSREVLETMATRALQFIMGEHMSLKIKLTGKRNKANAEFIVKSEYGDYVVETNPAEEEGGGVADVVATATFIAMRELAGGENVAPMFFDEPSKFVSKGHSAEVARFLYETSNDFERQTFMVTHDEYLASIGDKAYYFKLEDGVTKTTEVNR